MNFHTAYTPHSHYWRRQDGTVYASARQTHVNAHDAVYQAWCAAGNEPTPYPCDEHGQESAAELAAVLSRYGLPFTASSPDEQRRAPVAAVGQRCEQEYEPACAAAAEAYSVAAAAYSAQHAEVEARSADTAAPALSALPVQLTLPVQSALENTGATAVQAHIRAVEASIAPRRAAEAPQPAAGYSRPAAAAAAASAPESLAVARRIEKDVLVQRVMAEATLYKQVSALLLKQQQGIINAVQDIILDTRLADTDKLEALDRLDTTIGLPGEFAGMQQTYRTE